MKLRNLGILILVIGLVALTVSFGSAHFKIIPDFWQGFLKGFGVTVLVGGFIISIIPWKKPESK
jgi:hypothetical protein